MRDDITSQHGRRTFLKTTGAAAGAAALTTSVHAETGETLVRLLVGSSNAVSMSSAESSVQAVTPERASIEVREDTLGFFAVDVPESEIEGVVEEFESDAAFRYWEYDRECRMFADPNDELFAEQYAPQLVEAPTAYDRTIGSENVTIAIVDQGVMYDHPDLESRFGDLKGKDFVDDDDDPYPDSMSDEYHGTHVAGIASATTDNTEGIAGISNSTLLSVRVLGENGGGSISSISQGIRWAADNGADIINMSLGGGGYSDTMKNAVSYAVSNGTLPICAAGNDGSDSVSYPAGYSECVAVSAVDENDNLADFSQYGDKTDVAAPGVDVLSCWTEEQSQYGGKYNKISGTSMACPVATGVAALGLAVNRELDPNELRSRLKQSAVDIGLEPDEQGSGRVDAANMVGPIGPPEKPNASIDVSADTVVVGEAIEFDGTGSSDPDGTIESYEWDFDVGATASGPTATFSYDATGTFDVTLTVVDDDGASDTTAVEVVVEDDENQPPTASIDASTRDPEVGAPIEFSGAESDDPDGSIASFEWDFGDGETATGETASHAYEEYGEYDVALTVTDDDGASRTATTTISVPRPPVECGDTSSSADASGSLYGWYAEDSYTYGTDLADPCQVTFSLAGPASADFDLYVTFDGRTPSEYDYDARSITYGSDEQVVVDDVDADQEFGVLVDAYSGYGSYTITVDELGK